jgi:hypothetical protein
MREISGHPFDLGDGWERSLAGETRGLERLLEGYVAIEVYKLYLHRFITFSTCAS